MKSRLINILGIVIIYGLILFSVGCTNQNEQKSTVNIITDKEIVSPVKSETNEDVMKRYITDFLTNGYSKYYTINSIECKFVESNVKDASLEAIVFTTMNSCITTPPKVEPDMVPAIKEAKEKAEKEINQERKKALQKEYENLIEMYKQEYGKASDSNYTFKLTANLVNDKIEEKSIKLFLEQDANNGVIYIPAEEILPEN